MSDARRVLLAVTSREPTSAWLSARGLASRTRLCPAPTTASVTRAALQSGAGTLVVDGGWTSH